MTSKEFFEKVSHPPFKEFYYYTALANDLGNEVYADLAPLEPLMVKNASFKADIAYKLRWTNVWIGPSGATTHMHYDIFYNFYAQLYGRKRFILFPPTHRPYLYLYPFLHPGAQQSQVNLDAPDYNSFPLFQNARAVEAILEPGDVLYLPPMWFHHVTALDLSFSVSVWTFVNEVEEMWSVVRKPFPFRTRWSPRTLQYATRVFIEKIVDGLYGPGTSIDFYGDE
jgi:hypoxia-inducible factor 1-alpha inhibitor (HIF hydroxylase)